MATVLAGVRVATAAETGMVREVGTCAAPSPIVVDMAPTRVAGAPFSFAATWDTSVTNRAGWQNVIQFAMNEWQAVLTDNGCSTNPLPTYVRVRSLGAGNLLALTNVFSSAANGCVVFDTLTIDPKWAWFVDPTPGNDSEFNDPVLPPPAGFDLLSTVRHELGHAVGWVQTSRIMPLMTDSTFGGARMNILTTTTRGVGWHVNPDWLPDDLMVPSTPTAVRRKISFYPDVATVARGFDGGMPVGWVDPTHVGVETGMPSFPWRTLGTAQASTPGAWPIWLAGMTHHVPVNFVITELGNFEAVRGGAAVVAP
jgi:hypothetical protein